MHPEGDAYPPVADEESRRLSQGESLWDAEPGLKRSAPGYADAARGGRRDVSARGTTRGSPAGAADLGEEDEFADDDLGEEDEFADEDEFAEDDVVVVRPAPPARSGRSGLRATLLVGGAVALLLLGFFAGVAVTRGSARQSGTSATQVQRPTVTAPAPSGAVGREGSVPKACITAMDRADQVISYLIAKIRDQRLSGSLQAFVDSRRACQQAAVR